MYYGRYFFNTLAVRQADSRVMGLSKLSASLQEKIVWHINAVWLQVNAFAFHHLLPPPPLTYAMCGCRSCLSLRC